VQTLSFLKVFMKQRRSGIIQEGEQGGVLGPLLFPLKTVDLCALTQKSTFQFFSDFSLHLRYLAPILLSFLF
jgi:hypothetical protein